MIRLRLEPKILAQYVSFPEHRCALSSTGAEAWSFKAHELSGHREIGISQKELGILLAPRLSDEGLRPILA